MPLQNWVEGISQNLLATLLTAAGAVVMGWLHAIGWSWVGSVLYGLTTGVCLFILFSYWFSPSKLATDDQTLRRYPSYLAMAVLALLVLGSAGFDYYDRHRSWGEGRSLYTGVSLKTWNQMPLTQVWKKTFQAETVKLDGYEYIECTFDDVTLEYHGTAPTRLINVEFVKPGPGKRMLKFTSENPAVVNVVAILSALNMAPGMRQGGITIEAIPE